MKVANIVRISLTTVALGLLVWFGLMVAADRFGDGSPIIPNPFEGAHPATSMLWLLAFLIVVACVVIIGRVVLEMLGFAKSEDEWRDWREFPLSDDDNRSRTESSRPSQKRLLHSRGPWIRRGAVRKERHEPPRKYWGFNKQ
jgi:heme/copper-type cytochrome/quinol oxidase subunit 2